MAICGHAHTITERPNQRYISLHAQSDVHFTHLYIKILKYPLSPQPPSGVKTDLCSGSGEEEQNLNLISQIQKKSLKINLKKSSSYTVDL